MQSSHDQQVELPYVGAENPPTIVPGPQAETRGRRRRRSQSSTPDSRRPSPMSGTHHHYLPPTSSFSRSRSNSRSRSRVPRASIYPAYPASPYQTQWSVDPRAGRYVPLPSPAPYVVPPTYHSQPRPQFPPGFQPLPLHWASGISQIPPDQRTYSTYFTPPAPGIIQIPPDQQTYSTYFTPPPGIIQIPHDQRSHSTYFTPPGSTRSSRDRSATAELRSSLEHHPAAYVAVDPFRRTSSPSIIGSGLPVAYEYGDTPAPIMVYPFKSRRTLFKALIVSVLATFAEFIFDTVPRQLYLHFLLRLPYFYFSRVARIFEEADMTMPEIKEMAVTNVGQLQHNFIDFPQTVSMGPHMLNLKSSWEGFIESLLREWKTLNIISVLLLSYVLRLGSLHFFPILTGSNSAILTILQIQGAANDPLTRNCALFSLICALMSLLYGCMYIIRFGTMRKPHKAAAWAAVSGARCRM